MFAKKCDVKVQIDQNKVCCGDEISGKVVVVVMKSVECRGIYLKVKVTTKGRGDRNSFELRSDKVYEGFLNEGEEHTFDYKITVPDGDPTVYGNLINRIWLVVAEVDLKWAFDPSAETDFVVLPSKERAQLENRLTEVYDSSTVGDIAIGCFLFIFFSIVSVFSVVALESILESFSIMLSGEAVFGIISALIILLIIWFVRYFTRKKNFGMLNISMPEDIMFLGEKGEVKLILSPKSEWYSKSLTFTLFGEEWVQYTIGTDTRTVTEKLFEEVLYVEKNVVLEAKKENLFLANFELPINKSPSMNYSNNKVKWGIQVNCTDKNDKDLTSRTFFWVEQPSVNKPESKSLS